MKFAEKWGVSVDAAVELALEELNATREQIENIEVKEEPSRGFLGIGSKLALVRVTLKDENDTVEEKKDFENKVISTVNEDKPIANPMKKEKKSTENVDIAKTGKEINKADDNDDSDYVITNPFRKPNLDTGKNKRRMEIEESTEAAVLIADFNRDELEAVEEHPALDFLTELTDKMNIDVSFKARANEDTVFIEASGSQTSTLIGKRGSTLDAIQYLTSLVVNKGEHEYIRVIIDAEDYRKKRAITLCKLAQRLANNVLRSGRAVKLEPMNPYERKIIHTVLQKNNRITTRSEGKDPYRRVVIEKK